MAAELYRLKGQLLLREGHSEAADELYRKALSIAREQEAGWPSPRITSKHSSIASRAFACASSRVSPYVMTGGSLGQVTVNPPSGSERKWQRYATSSGWCDFFRFIVPISPKAPLSRRAPFGEIGSAAANRHLAARMGLGRREPAISPKALAPRTSKALLDEPS